MYLTVAAYAHVGSGEDNKSLREAKRDQAFALKAYM